MERARQYTQVEFGGQSVNVIKDGLYNRFRSNPDLAEIAKGPLVGNID